jgi:hypothetical protein
MTGLALVKPEVMTASDDRIACSLFTRQRYAERERHEASIETSKLH